MPGAVVFPGGAVDAGDGGIALAGPLPAESRDRLIRDGTAAPDALAVAAIRELFEETGQIAGRLAEWADPPGAWRAYAATGHRPDAGALDYVLRAVTPPGRSRRFDARFFKMPAEALMSDPDDFSAASGELSDLEWIAPTETGGLHLPLITRRALATVMSEPPLSVARPGST